MWQSLNGADRETGCHFRFNTNTGVHARKEREKYETHVFTVVWACGQG